MNNSCRSVTVVFAMTFVAFLAIERVEAVNNCFYCDPNEADCHDSRNYKVVKCGTLANTAPCFKVKSTGYRGCGTYPICVSPSSSRNADYDQKRPWLWILHNLFPVAKDCFSPTEGCNELMCCRDFDRCNSASALHVNVLGSLLSALGLAVKLILF